MLSKRRDSQGGTKKEWGLGRVGEEWHSPDPIRPKPPPFFTPPLLSCRVQFRYVLLNEWLEKACNNKQQLNMSPERSVSAWLAWLRPWLSKTKLKKEHFKIPWSIWEHKFMISKNCGRKSVDRWKIFDLLNTADQIYLTLILSMWYTFSYY